MKDGTIHQCTDPLNIITKPATPFVGSFVSNNNLLNIEYKNGSYYTPFGSVIVQPHLLKEQPNILMIDDLSLDIKPSKNSNALTITPFISL